MPGEEECLSDLICEMKQRFGALGFTIQVTTVTDNGNTETIKFKFMRDNTREAAWNMTM